MKVTVVAVEPVTSADVVASTVEVASVAAFPNESSVVPTATQVRSNVATPVADV